MTLDWCSIGLELVLTLRLTFRPRLFVSRCYLRNHAEESAPLFAQNFDAVLVMISVLAGETIFAKFWQEVWKTHAITHFVHFTELTCSKFPGTPFSPNKKNNACGRLTSHTKLIISRKTISVPLVKIRVPLAYH